jgi:peptidoglycan/LPS O-acetylase OafA/YrhL
VARFSFSLWPGGAGASLLVDSRKLPGLHGLRALAASMVVLYHLHAIPSLAVPGALNLVTSHFGLGVHLFFVISAFSLAYAHSSGEQRWSAYFIKRFFRIAPLFYGMFLVYGLLFGFPPWNMAVTNLLFVFNLVPGHQHSLVWAGWTIGVEMLFYALLPVILIVCRSPGALLGFGAVAVLASLGGRASLEGGLVQGYAHESFISNLAYFALGMVGYLAYSRLGGQRWVPGGAMLLAVGFAAWLLSPSSIFLIPLARADVLAWGVVFALVCLGQSRQPLWPLTSALAQYMGERSFSLYLLHPLLIHYLKPVYARIYQGSGLGDWAFLPCAALTFSLLLLLAGVTYRLVEVPGIELARRLSRRKAEREPTADFRDRVVGASLP